MVTWGKGDKAERDRDGGIAKGYKETFWSHRYILCLDCGDVFMAVDICQN